MRFDILKMYAIFPSLGVRKLTGKPAFLTIADSESEAPRIHNLIDYVDCVPEPAAESNACRIQSGFFCPDARIAWLIVFASGWATLTVKNTALASFVPTFGLPTLFFIINVHKKC